MNNSNLKMNYDDFGEMRSANNTVVKEFQKGNYDYISIDELLSAAGKWKQQNLCFPPLLPSTFPILLLLLKLSSRTLLRCPPPVQGISRGFILLLFMLKCAIYADVITILAFLTFLTFLTHPQALMRTVGWTGHTFHHCWRILTTLLSGISE